MRNFFFALIAGFFLFIFGFENAFAEVNLVKLKRSPSVYYLDGQKSRHAFPNEITYRSWFGNDYTKVMTVSEEFLAKIPLGKNITLRPGKFLAKVPSDAKIYSVEEGGVLRHIENEGIAEYFYGKNWTRRLVDIPEVFFGDYRVGEEILSENDIPNSTVYKIANESKYYWKRDDVLWQFSDAKAILENGYAHGDAIEGKRLYSVRSRPVRSKDQNISSPLNAPRISNTDCENEKLKGAFVFIYQDAHTQDDLEKTELLKKNFSSYFEWSTREFSHIDLSYPTILLPYDEYLKYPEGKDLLKLDPNEAASTFYDANPDVFDFLFIFTNFEVLRHREQALYIPVTNRVLGNGKAQLESASLYGSRGKLKAVIIMDSIRKYDLDTDEEKYHVMNLMMHEVLHQWSGELAFTDEGGKTNFSLLRAQKDGKPDFEHWNFYVDFLSPLGGAGWRDNNDGTFTSATSLQNGTQKIRAADIDLYLMGLLPRQVVQPVSYILTNPPDATGNTVSGARKEVTMQQILEANGRWQCNLSE